MVMLDTLRHIDHPELLLVVEQVVLGQVSMHQFAYLVEVPHHHASIVVESGGVIVTQLGILQSRGRISSLADELHHYDVVSQILRPGRFDDSGHADPLEVSDFFLGPELHFLARIALAVSFPESELTTDVALSVLEHQDAGLEDLDSVVDGLLLSIDHRQVVEVRTPGLSQIDVGLFTS